MSAESLGDITARYAAPFRMLPGIAPVWVAEVSAPDWMRIAQTVRADGGRLISIWGTDRPVTGKFIMSAAYCAQEGLLWLQLPVADEQDGYPDLSIVFPAAVRMQRAVFDLLGI